jgi:hypothetical protein
MTPTSAVGRKATAIFRFRSPFRLPSRRFLPVAPQVARLSNDDCRDLKNAAVFALRREWPRFSVARPHSDATLCENKETPEKSPVGRAFF